MVTAAQNRALTRAVEVYGDTLAVEPEPQTVTTLQGRTERGYIVYGRAYGGDPLGCVFRTKAQARAAIAKAAA